MFAFRRANRRSRALDEPFPEEWRELLARSMAHWSSLDNDERGRLEDLIRVFLVDKRWEAAQGFELTDDIRVLISAMACELILELDYDYFRTVDWIVVRPSMLTITRPSPTGVGGVVSTGLQLLGEAHHDGGPVWLAWDHARFEGVHPELGSNVAHHEFAHKIDMLDGVSDGTPPLADTDLRRRWIDVCTREHDAIRDGVDLGVLDPYAGMNPAEFFAVSTEAFFNRPTDLRHLHAELYGLLAEFYRQDPARRAAGDPYNGGLSTYR